MATAAKSVDGGMLRSRVRVVKDVSTITATGGTATAAPVTVLDGVWVSIETLEMSFQLREQLAAGGIQAQLTHLIRARRDDAIAASMVLQELDGAGRSFEIVVRRLDTYADELHLLCQEKVI